MSDDYKTLRVPEEAWTEAKEQKESAGRTWGEQIVRPDGDKDSTTNAEVVEGLTNEIRDQIDALAFQGAMTEEEVQRIESSLATIEGRMGAVEKSLEELRESIRG